MDRLNGFLLLLDLAELYSEKEKEMLAAFNYLSFNVLQ